MTVLSVEQPHKVTARTISANFTVDGLHAEFNTLVVARSMHLLCQGSRGRFVVFPSS